MYGVGGARGKERTYKLDSNGLGIEQIRSYLCQRTTSVAYGGRAEDMSSTLKDDTKGPFTNLPPNAVVDTDDVSSRRGV